MPFEVGKEYLTKGGRKMRVLATDRPSTIIPPLSLVVMEVDSQNGQVYVYQADGSYPPNSQFNLVDLDEPTEEEREKIVKIYEAFYGDPAKYYTPYVTGERTCEKDSITGRTIKRLLEYVRNEGR